MRSSYILDAFYFTCRCKLRDSILLQFILPDFLLIWISFVSVKLLLRTEDYPKNPRTFDATLTCPFFNQLLRQVLDEKVLFNTKKPFDRRVLEGVVVTAAMNMQSELVTSQQIPERLKVRMMMILPSERKSQEQGERLIWEYQCITSFANPFFSYLISKLIVILEPQADLFYSSDLLFSCVNEQ